MTSRYRIGISRNMKYESFSVLVDLYTVYIYIYYISDRFFTRIPWFIQVETRFFSNLSEALDHCHILQSLQLWQQKMGGLLTAVAAIHVKRPCWLIIIVGGLY